jgi:diacylglycerol kinase
MKRHSFINAFRYAGRGLIWAVLQERSLRLEIGALIIVAGLGSLLNITLGQWLLVFGIALAVIVTELINSSIEALADTVHPEFNENIGHAKDIAAGAVLLVSLAALVIGYLVFVPSLLNLVY